METSEYSFLPYLINEPVYLIDRPLQTTKANNPVSNEVKIPSPTPKIVSPVSPAVAEVKQPVFKEVIVVMAKSDEIKKPFLEKILLAVSINFSDVTVYHSIASIPAEISYKKALCFGENHESIPLYTPTVKNNRQILVANPLVEIEQDVSKKKQLWACLQTMFLKS